MEPRDSPTFNAKKLKFSNEQKGKTKKNNEVDRISNLSDTVLHHILSLLDMKHVVQTSILSTRWRYVWKSLTTLNFNSNLFHYRTPEMACCFKDFVDHALHLRDSYSNIQRFHLFCSRPFDITCYLRSWIFTALKQNVQELYLNVSIAEKFRFPVSLFTCKSLKVLKLKYCGYLLKLNLPDLMSLPGLKTLILHKILFEGDDITNKIFSNCPNLESLTITKSRFDQPNLNITSLKLNYLVVEDCYGYCGIKLFAPNLISICCEGYVWQDYSIENLSALVKAEIDMNYKVYGKCTQVHEEVQEMYAETMMKFLKAVQNVKTLTLSGWFLQVVSGAPALLESTSTQFCNLRYLKLATWLSRDCVGAVTYLLSISPNIESLFLDIKMNDYNPQLIYPYWDEVRLNSAEIEAYWEAGVSLQCMMYHLKYVEIRNVQGCLNEIMFLEILLKNAMVLEKVALFTWTEESSDSKRRLTKFSEQLLTLPTASSKLTISLF